MPEKSEMTYGRTRSGVEITEELLKRDVAEAEAGLDLSTLRRVQGRPLMGAAPAKSFPVRLDPELRQQLDERAAQEDRPAAEILRDALRRYLTAT